MKKLLFISATFLSIASYSQPYIVKSCDDMTDKCIFYSSENVIIASEDRKTGFTVALQLSEKSGRIEASGIMCKVVNIGTCEENDKLILMLADSTKLSFVSWNKFNCEGNAWFNLKQSDVEKLASQKILKAYIQNGRTYDSFSGEIPVEDQEYFIKLIADCRQNKFTKE